MELVKNSRLREAMIDRCEQELNHKETGREMRFVGGDVSKPKTNADRIRAMSDGELADFMTRRNVTESCLRLADEGYTPTEEQKQVLYDSLYPVWMEWLQQPAEGE